MATERMRTFDSGRILSIWIPSAIVFILTGLVVLVVAITLFVVIVLVGSLVERIARDHEQVSLDELKVFAQCQEACVQSRLGFGQLERFEVMKVCVGEYPGQSSEQSWKVPQRRRRDRESVRL